MNGLHLLVVVFALPSFRRTLPFFLKPRPMLGLSIAQRRMHTTGLPLSWSRLGMCGYIGHAEPPY
jgi:hypothetical protein